jgi:hypothetical protein
MEYSHEELMNELEIEINDLPSEIRKNVVSFNRKKRMALKPESIALLESVSDDVADEITAWYYATSDDKEDEDEEYKEPEPIQVQKPVLEQGGSIISHVQNIEVQDEQKQIDNKNSGWGINLEW